MQQFTLEYKHELTGMILQSMYPHWYKHVRNRLPACLAEQVWGSDDQLRRIAEMGRTICTTYCDSIGRGNVRDYYTACSYSYIEADRTHCINFNIPLPDEKDDRLNIQFLRPPREVYYNPTFTNRGENLAGTKIVVTFPKKCMWMLIGHWASQVVYNRDLGTETVHVDQHMDVWPWRIVHAFAAMEMVGISSEFFWDGADLGDFK